MDTDMVWMKHPTLDSLIEIPRAAVTGHELSGWRITDPPAPPEPEETDAADESGTSRRSGRSTAQRGTNDEGKE